jgi:hypothetical protein
MNTTVTAEIDVATLTGRRIVHDLERHNRTVKLNYPAPESATEKTYTITEAYNECCDILSAHYGCDVRKIQR